MIKLLKHKSVKLFATYMRAKHLYSPPVLLTKRKILINEQERNTIVLNKDKR